MHILFFLHCALRCSLPPVAGCGWRLALVHIVGLSILVLPLLLATPGQQSYWFTTLYGIASCPGVSSSPPPLPPSPWRSVMGLYASKCELLEAIRRVNIFVIQHIFFGGGGVGYVYMFGIRKIKKQVHIEYLFMKIKDHFYKNSKVGQSPFCLPSHTIADP